jgi:hypothetical protein
MSRYYIDVVSVVVVAAVAHYSRNYSVLVFDWAARLMMRKPIPQNGDNELLQLGSVLDSLEFFVGLLISNYSQINMRTSVVGFMRSNYFLSSLLAASVLLVASVTFAAISFASYSQANSNDVTVTQVTVSPPASIIAGNLLLANISINGGNQANVTAPSGWTQILRTDNDSSISIVSYYKIATASEPSNYTWSIDHQTTAKGEISQYSGIDSSNPIDSSSGNTGLGTVATTTSVTTSSANVQIVTLFGVDVGKSANAGAYFTQPTGMTERYDLSNTPFGPSNASDDVVQATAGSSGSNSSAISGNKARNWVAQQIALRAPSHQISVETGTNGSTSYAICSKANPITFSKTVSATSTLLIVHVNSGLETGVKYAGIAMTLATTSSFQTESTWYLVNPTSGTNQVEVDFSAISGGYGSAVSYTGTDTSNPLGAMSSNGSTGGNPSVSITTTNDNSVIDDNLFYNIGQTLTADAPQVQQAGVQCSGNSSHGASVLQTATHGIYTLGWTHSGLSSDWGDVAVEINAAQ